GYEVQTVQAAVDWFCQRYGPNAKVGVCGYAEGGLISLYAAAVDSRIAATLVSGYFDSRQAVWAEPIYRNIWGLLRELGGAERASPTLPRSPIGESSTAPPIEGQKGEWRTPVFSSVALEVQRVETGPGFRKPTFIHGENGSAVPPFSDAG